ncbi:MAG: multidrug efflux SMR transporter [Gammaproteobacteria bacterium]|nr:multidrug efflux SMR transporter [Gammaproteobacteria bacterium]
MEWMYLVLAGVFEIGFTTCLKLSDGFRRIGWALAFVVTAMLSFGLLTLSLATIPLGTAYAIWTGIGASGTAVVGMAFFRDPATIGRIAFIFLLVAAIIGLKLVS